ncbi:calcium-binding protein [Campylobacter sp.]|uniref:calcium-binding protein n=1 Tax=Campylobacter sp. TaxID=205 RepID=UPI00270FFC6A|nr:calcium-binding protein [Campylobacter sp.]
MEQKVIDKNLENIQDMQIAEHEVAKNLKKLKSKSIKNRLTDEAAETQLVDNEYTKNDQISVDVQKKVEFQKTNNDHSQATKSVFLSQNNFIESGHLSNVYGVLEQEEVSVSDNHIVLMSSDSKPHFIEQKIDIQDEVKNESKKVYSRSILGTAQNEVLNGTDENDFIDGYLGDDYIYGYEGDDGVRGGFGNDKIYGGLGNDELYGDEGNDMIDGSIGDDFIDGGVGNDDLSGGRGADNIKGGDGHDHIYGGDGHDILNGGAGDDEIYGENGNDRILGGEGSDKIWGGPGDDVVFGEDGDDQIVGDAGNDILNGGAGDDAIFGQEGDDRINGSSGNDRIWGGFGEDYIYGQLGLDQIFGDDGDDTIVGSLDDKMLDGGSGFDTLRLTPDSAENENFDTSLTIDFDNIQKGNISNFEKIDLGEGQNSTHITNLDPNDVLDMISNESIILKISGDNQDSIGTKGFARSQDQQGVESGYTRYEGYAADGTEVITIKIDIDDDISKIVI